ncbi:MAG: hypothetical protein Q4D76_19220 [Oscillospiraceae bacterium]|nr:hypothetical protein [Oscillospiraceae bacterium]
MSYKFYNANSKGNFVNDCTIRAISLAEGKSWQQTYDELSRIAGRNGIILDDVNFIEPLLDSRYKRVRETGSTVGEFIKQHPYGTYLITMKGHITCCVDGTIFDTFDCRDKTMWCAWRVE